MSLEDEIKNLYKQINRIWEEYETIPLSNEALSYHIGLLHQEIIEKKWEIYERRQMQEVYNDS